MPVLSQDEKGRVIGHLESVKSISDVAKMFGCTRATIHSLKQKFAATGTLKRKKGSGRKISTTEIQENAIITAHELNHFKTAAKKKKKTEQVQNKPRTEICWYTGPKTSQETTAS